MHTYIQWSELFQQKLENMKYIQKKAQLFIDFLRECHDRKLFIVIESNNYFWHSHRVNIIITLDLLLTKFFGIIRIGNKFYNKLYS